MPRILKPSPRPDDCFLFIRNLDGKDFPVLTFHRVTFDLAHKFRVLVHERIGFPLYGIKKLANCQCRGKVIVSDT